MIGGCCGDGSTVGSLTLFLYDNWRPFSHATQSLGKGRTRQNFVSHCKQHIWTFYDGLVGAGRKGGRITALCRPLGCVYNTCTDTYTWYQFTGSWVTACRTNPVVSASGCVRLHILTPLKYTFGRWITQNVLDVSVSLTGFRAKSGKFCTMHMSEHLDWTQMIRVNHH